MESARRANTVLVGDDTDLIILLCYYTEMSAEELFFSASVKGKFDKIMCLEHESSEAGSRRVQQHFLHPQNSWM